MVKTTLLRGACCALLGALAACGGSMPLKSASSSTSTGSTAASTTTGSTSTTTTTPTTSVAVIALSSSTYTAAPSSSAVLTIDRSGSSTDPMTVTYATVNGSAVAGTDYVATSGSVTWNAGDTSTKTVSVPITGQAGGKTLSFALKTISGHGKFGSPASAKISVSAGTTASTGTGTSTGTGMSIGVQGNRLIDAQGKTVQLRGVNVSGLESGIIFKGGTDFWQSSGLPGRPDFTKIAAWKANSVRLPLNEDSWLGLTVTGLAGNTIVLNGAAYQAEVEATVAAANAAGLYVILDLHWTAPGHFAANTQNPFLDADNSINFWTSVANAFKNNRAVMFEVFNEPFVCPASKGGVCSAPSGVNANQLLANGGTEDYYIGLSTGTYGGSVTRVAYTYKTVGYQQVIDAIRGTGATNVVICGGNNYDDDLTWWTQFPVTDPLNQLAAAVHHYPGEYPYNAVTGPTAIDAMLAPIATGHPIILTELGDEVGSNPAPFATQVLAWADSQGYSVMAWAWNPWGGANTLIQNATSYTPTVGFGQTFHDWTINHQ